MVGDKSNVLIALVGRSGAGKSVSAKYLEDIYGLKYLRSYTTREKRADKLDDHTYVNLAQYSRITGKVAENYYTGNWYCATESQCDDADVYVVDVPGLKQLKENYRLFIVSNCQAGYIEVFLETSGLGSYFEGHLCPGDTGNAKADNICKIIQEYHLKAPVYVGDTLGDFNATKTAGIPFVFASYGFGQVPSPDYTIHCPGDLLNIF